MGFFDWLKGKGAPVVEAADLPSQEAGVDIPKGLFVEERDPDEQTLQSAVLGFDVDSVFAFMRTDLENKGYHHALTNPDDSYRADNVKLIKLELRIRIDRAKLHYHDKIKEIEDHIETRARAGLHDLAKELEVRKRIYADHLATLESLSAEVESESSTTFRVALSYQTGFRKGLAAITQSRILNGEEY